MIAASTAFAATLLAWNLQAALYLALSALDGPGMLLIALLDSSLLSVPEGNDFLIVALSIGKAWSRVAYYVTMTTAGSVCGCLLLYSLGRRGTRPLRRAWLSPAKISRVAGLFQKYGAFTLLVPSVLPPPCPFKIFVFGAGVLGVPLRAFVAAITLGRLIRYSMWGMLALYLGPRVKDYMIAHLPKLGLILACLLLSGIAVAAGVYWHAARKKPAAD